MGNVKNKKSKNEQQKENESDKRDFSDREDEIFNIGRDSFFHQRKEGLHMIHVRRTLIPSKEKKEIKKKKKDDS